MGENAKSNVLLADAIKFERAFRREVAELIGAWRLMTPEDYETVVKPVLAEPEINLLAGIKRFTTLFEKKPYWL